MIWSERAIGQRSAVVVSSSALQVGALLPQKAALSGVWRARPAHDEPGYRIEYKLEEALATMGDVPVARRAALVVMLGADPGRCCHVLGMFEQRPGGEPRDRRQRWLPGGRRRRASVRRRTGQR